MPESGPRGAAHAAPGNAALARVGVQGLALIVIRFLFNFARLVFLKFPPPSAQVRRYMMMCTDLSSLIHILILRPGPRTDCVHTHAHADTAN